MNLIDQLRRDEGLRLTERACSVCTLMLPEAAFRPNKRQCRECENARKRKSANKNRELTNERNRAKYHANKAKFRATQRKYEAKIRELARDDREWHAKALLKLARSRARRMGLPFSITRKDIPVPEVCPVLGIPLARNRRVMAQNSATVDRIKPSLGYVPGNVIVISLKANAIKNNGTPDEILRVGMFFKNIEGLTQ